MSVLSLAASELFTGPLSCTQPDPTGETLTQPTIAAKKTVWPDPHMCYIMFHEFNIQVANMEQYTNDFDGNGGNYFSPGLVMFPEGGKNESRVVLFHKTVISRQQPTANRYQ